MVYKKKKDTLTKGIQATVIFFYRFQNNTSPLCFQRGKYQWFIENGVNLNMKNILKFNSIWVWYHLAKSPWRIAYLWGIPLVKCSMSYGISENTFTCFFGNIVWESIKMEVKSYPSSWPVISFSQVTGNRDGRYFAEWITNVRRMKSTNTYQDTLFYLRY